MNEKKCATEIPSKLYAWDRSVWKCKRVRNQMEKKMWQNNNQFMICGKVSNGNDYVLHYTHKHTLKVFITVRSGIYCVFLYSLFLPFVCFQFCFFWISYNAPNGMKY